MEKVKQIKEYIQSADMAVDDKNEHYKVDNGEITTSLGEPVFLTDEMLEKSYFEDGALVVTFSDVGQRYFTFKKIRDIPVPVGLLNCEQLADLFEEIADEAGGTVYEGYSGRFMFNEECWGIHGEADEIIKAATERGLTGHRRDSFGLEAIVYWPKIAYERMVKDK